MIVLLLLQSQIEADAVHGVCGPESSSFNVTMYIQKPLPEGSVPDGIAECHSPCVQCCDGQVVRLLPGQVQLSGVDNCVASQRRQQPMLGDLWEDRYCKI